MTSSGGDVFQSALSDFTFEAACGGAIRHLTDSGLTVKQIMEKLDYPISGDRVRKAVYKHLCDTGVILEEPPEDGIPGTKPEYVLEYNSYGKPSYRRKRIPNTRESGTEPDLKGIVWKEGVYRPAIFTPASNEPGAVPAAGHLTPHGDSKDMPEKEYRISRRRKRKEGFRNPGQNDLEVSAGSLGRGEGLSVFLAERISSEHAEPAYISCDFGVPDSAAAKGLLLLNGRQREYLEGIPWPRRRVYHRLDYRMTEILCSLYEQHAYDGICYFLSSGEKILIK